MCLNNEFVHRGRGGRGTEEVLFIGQSAPLSILILSRLTTNASVLVSM